MTTLHHLLAACGTDDATLIAEAQPRLVDWAPWLHPFDDHPTGRDPIYNDDFQSIREEVNKLSGMDTVRIGRLTKTILTEFGKDLRVITFYVWARLHQDGDTGLAEGLELLAAMLIRYGDKLHPERERSRTSALEWLCSSRVTDSLLRYPEVDMTVMRRITGALLLIDRALQTLSEGSKPDLSGFHRALENRLAQSGGAKSMVPQTSDEAETISPGLTSPAPALHAIASGRDLLDQAKVLAHYLRDQPGGWLAGHHLMKSVRWDTLTTLPPLDAAGRTRLNSPKPDSRAHLKRLYLQNSWAALLEYTDVLMAQGVNHLWLDVQWYAWQALNQLDADAVRADILCRDLQGLLARLPGLETLAFSDGTPFADEVTLNWIDEQVQGDSAGWTAPSVVTHSSSEHNVLALEPEVLAKADEQGIEAALGWLQAQSGNTSPRERWLMRLLMARVTEQHGKNDMALHLLGELDSSAARLTSEHWAPELLFEVKARRLKLLRAKAGRNDADKNRLRPEMDQLLSGLIALDPARAAVLCG